MKQVHGILNPQPLLLPISSVLMEYAGSNVESTTYHGMPQVAKSFPPRPPLQQSLLALAPLTASLSTLEAYVDRNR